MIKLIRWFVWRTEEIFEELKVFNVFSALDLFQGFWNVKIHEACMELSVSIAQSETNQFESMAFALLNTLAEFWEMMEEFFKTSDSREPIQMKCLYSWKHFQSTGYN